MAGERTKNRVRNGVKGTASEGYMLSSETPASEKKNRKGKSGGSSMDSDNKTAADTKDAHEEETSVSATGGVSTSKDHQKRLAWTDREDKTPHLLA